MREVNCLYPLAEAESLAYPNFVCVTLDFHATGEGRTTGMLIVYAMSVEDLRAEVSKEWDEAMTLSAYARVWDWASVGNALLFSEALRDFLKKSKTMNPTFRHVAKLHFNFS